MRKSLLAVLGCIVLGGLVMATPTAPEPQPPNYDIQINGNPETNGVDQPWFELSVTGQNTVKWTNGTADTCQIVWQNARSPISWQVKRLAPGESSVAEPTNKQCPTGSAPDKVCRAYWYAIVCPGGPAPYTDPGGGIRP